MLNHIVIMGRLTRDPEVRYTQSQLPVASFTLAVDRDYTGKDGGEKQTDFINCVAWRTTADFVSKYFHKGSMAVVSGRLQMRQYQDKDDNNRTAAEVVVDSIYFGESKREGNQSPTIADNRSQPQSAATSSSQPPQSYTPPAQQDFADMGTADDGELPF